VASSYPLVHPALPVNQVGLLVKVVLSVVEDNPEIVGVHGAMR
jgi:hypothetical protein